MHGACAVVYAGGTQYEEWHTKQRELAAELPNVHYLSLWDLVCVADTHTAGAGTCPIVLPGTNIVTVVDYDHISLDAGEYLKAHLCYHLFASGIIA